MVIGISVVRDQEVLVEGRNTYVFLDAATSENREIPDWIRRGMARFAVMPRTPRARAGP